MSYQPLHHKYRPQTFGDLVGQEAISTTLSNALINQKIAPAYLFSGPRGTGKTSSARIFAKSLNCLENSTPTPNPCGKCDVCKSITNGSALDVIEIDAASNTGVDNIREIIERAQFAPVQCRYKVYVIDECHMLSTAAFNALLKTLEEPPERVIFILATTDPQRVLPTIISRCQRFDYRRIPLDAMVSHLEKIAIEEKIDITLDAITIVAQIANGGLRDAESLLDQLSLLSGEINVDRVWDLVGAVAEQDLLILLQAIRADQTEKVLSQCRDLMNKGREPLTVLQNLAAFYLNLAIAKTAPNRNDLVALTASTWQKLVQEAQQWQLGQILAGQQHLKNSEVQIKHTTQPRLWLEITLLGLLPSALIPSQQVINQTAPSSFLKVNQSNINNNHAVIPTVETSQLPVENYNINTSSIPPTPPTQINKPLETNNKVVPIRPEINNYLSNNQDAVTDIDQENIWQKLLNHVQPATTKAFLEQQCYLISFNGNLAEIAVKNNNLMKIAQSKLINIEKGFNAITGRKVRVELRLVNSDEKKNSISVKDDNDHAINQNNIKAENNYLNKDNQQQNNGNNKSFNNILKLSSLDDNQEFKENKYQDQKLIDNNSKDLNNNNQSDLLINESLEESLTDNLENVTNSNFEKAVENFAKFFKGEIINLDNIDNISTQSLDKEEND